MRPLPAVAAAAACCAARAARAPLDKPNFVMFFVDDLGYGDVGFTGHPTTHTPNIDRLARGGRVLATWYSGCSVCSGSRGALMTGRQYVRLGIPGVFGPTVATGLPLNETTVAEQLKTAGYRTAAMGKWHLGQRPMYLPMARGFDRYLGIPFSDDMGAAQWQYTCNNTDGLPPAADAPGAAGDWQQYVDAGLTLPDDVCTLTGNDKPPLPLVHQDAAANISEVAEQPLQFRTLAQKYRDFVVGVVEDFKSDPFFLYMPFSHVHTTAHGQPESQYSGCAFEGSTSRGKFGDALAEADWIIGGVADKLKSEGLEQNTLVMFSSDNGPWMIQGKSAGSTGLLYGRTSGYWNVGKGSTWEGGIREPAFAYWPGQIAPASRTSEVVSSLDLFPTFSKLAGVPLPEGRVYDGRDASDVILHGGRTAHDFLFFYGGKTPSAVRHGVYKAHFKTHPGLGGCDNCTTKTYDPTAPLLFDIEQDPSEAYPLSGAAYADVIAAIAAAYQNETSGPGQMTFQTLIAPPAAPGETPGDWGVCCDHKKACSCTPAGPHVPAGNYKGCWNDKSAAGGHKCDFAVCAVAGPRHCPDKNCSSGGGWPPPPMSLELCNVVCKGYRYFGVSGGSMCFCGATFGSQGQLPDAMCNLTCTGDAAEQCGGQYRENGTHGWLINANSVYLVVNATGPSA